jgi:hypothetical protein
MIQHEYQALLDHITSTGITLPKRQSALEEMYVKLMTEASNPQQAHIQPC